MTTPSITEAIHKLDRDFMGAVEAADAGSLVSAFYAEDAVLMPPNQPAVEGATAIEKVFGGLMAAGLRRARLETTRIESAGDLAYGRGRYRLEISPVGAQTVVDIGKYVVVYRRDSQGGWRAIVDIFNTDLEAR